MERKENLGQNLNSQAAVRGRACGSPDKTFPESFLKDDRLTRVTFPLWYGPLARNGPSTSPDLGAPFVFTTKQVLEAISPERTAEKG